MATSPHAEPVFPAGRYGHRRDATHRRRRWLAYTVAILVVAGSVAIAIKLYRQYVQAPYQVREVGVTDIADGHVTLSFEVRVPAGAGALCTVVALAHSGEEVGRTEIATPAGATGQDWVRVTHTLTTTKRPVAGEVRGCGPRSATSATPPGPTPS